MGITWDQTAYETLYRLRVPAGEPDAGQVVGYGRRWADLFSTPASGRRSLEFYQQRWEKLRELFPALVPASRVLVVGAGFGYLVEAAHDQGYANVWGLEPSTYIQARKGIESRGDVILVASSITGGGQLRATLRSVTGDDEFDFVISEELLESFDDAEIPALLNAAETVLAVGAPLSQIVHMMACPVGSTAPGMNIKTLAQWNAARPAHSWVSVETWEVL